MDVGDLKMSATNITVLQEAQYRAVSNAIGKYWLEKTSASYIPLISDPAIRLDQKEFRHSYFGQSKAGFGSHEFTPILDRAETPLNYKTYYLENLQLALGYNINEIAEKGDAILNQMQLAQIEQYIYDVDYAYWHGIFAERNNKVQLNSGILEQATIVENLNGTNSTLATKGDIWKGIKAMIDTIPFKYRQNSQMVLFVTPNILAEASDPTRIYNDKVEMEKIMDSFIYSAPQGYRLNDIIPTDAITALATDTASGDGSGAADTGGSTDDRMVLAILDPSVIGRVESRSFSLLGDVNDGLGGRISNWATKFAGCVFDSSAVLYSEKIVWS